MYLFSSSCLCPVLAFSVLYFEKNRNRLRDYSKIRQFDKYQIAFLMKNQGQKYLAVHFSNDEPLKTNYSWYVTFTVIIFMIFDGLYTGRWGRTVSRPVKNLKRWCLLSNKVTYQDKFGFTHFYILFKVTQTHLLKFIYSEKATKFGEIFT